MSSLETARYPFRTTWVRAAMDGDGRVWVKGGDWAKALGWHSRSAMRIAHASGIDLMSLTTGCRPVYLPADSLWRIAVPAAAAARSREFNRWCARTLVPEMRRCEEVCRRLAPVRDEYRRAALECRKELFPGREPPAGGAPARGSRKREGPGTRPRE